LVCTMTPRLSTMMHVNVIFDATTDTKKATSLVGLK
jgi:hypothetical protein